MLTGPRSKLKNISSSLPGIDLPNLALKAYPIFIAFTYPIFIAYTYPTYIHSIYISWGWGGKERYTYYGAAEDNDKKNDKNDNTVEQHDVANYDDNDNKDDNNDNNDNKMMKMIRMMRMTTMTTIMTTKMNMIRMTTMTTYSLRSYNATRGCQDMSCRGSSLPLAPPYPHNLHHHHDYDFECGDDCSPNAMKNVKSPDNIRSPLIILTPSSC